MSKTAEMLQAPRRIEEKQPAIGKGVQHEASFIMPRRYRTNHRIARTAIRWKTTVGETSGHGGVMKVVKVVVGGVLV